VIPIPPQWGHGAADVTPPDPGEGGLYPSNGYRNSEQAAQSAYHGREWEAAPEALREVSHRRTIAQEDEDRAQAKFIAELAYFMMVKMEPSDRCLRPPGDIFDYKRLNSQGLELPEPGHEA
jgi:hypothetical protein